VTGAADRGSKKEMTELWTMLDASRTELAEGTAEDTTVASSASRLLAKIVAGLLDPCRLARRNRAWDLGA
jgi:hypothetical protein